MGFTTISRFLTIFPLCVIAFCAEKFDYKLLATSKTSSMEKEMNRAADEGFVFASVMGGESAFGGKEVIVVMKKGANALPAANRRYLLLATQKTSTLQRELQQAGDDGFEYRGQTVFESAFGGREVSIIMERAGSSSTGRREFKVLATSKTSTMENELRQAGETGFELIGMVIGKTALGGREVISILRKAEE